MIKIDRIRILLTEQCNANCAFCFNIDSRKPKHMDTQKAISLLEQLSNNILRLKIMGGEPTIHPEFLRIYSYAQEKFLAVDLFTNALDNTLLKIKPRANDRIIYNITFIDKNFDFAKLLQIYDFGRSFETMIGSTTEISQLKKKIQLIVERCVELEIRTIPKFSITLNCVENIFEKKEILNEKWRELVGYIIKINPLFLGFDHSVPFCFWTDETKEFIKKNNITDYLAWTCRPGCYGLINSDFELLHCNQHPIKIGCVFENDEQSKLISFDELNNILLSANTEKTKRNLDSQRCKSCEFAGKTCTGGCFLHKYQD